MHQRYYITGLVLLVATLVAVPAAAGGVVGDIPSGPTAVESTDATTVSSDSEATRSSDGAQFERVNATQSQSQTITFIGPTDTRADYELSVTGELESVHGMGEEDSLSGSTANGAVWSGSDSYQYTGTISSIDVNGDLDIVFDRTWHTITIEGREDSGRIDYSFSAEREVAAAQNIGEEDTIDGATVDGAVWSGSDTYRFSGDPDTVKDSLSVGDAADVYIDGERIGGTTERTIEYVNCTAARITGDFDWVQVRGTSNAPDGIDTYIWEPDRGDLPKQPDGSVILRTDSVYTYGINGSYIEFITLYTGDNSEEKRPEDSHTERCRQSVAPRVDASLVDVKQTGPGTYNVTFSYRNYHDTDLYAGETLQGSVRGTDYEVTPDALKPGQHTFSVTWTPTSDDERLTWVVIADNDGFVGVDEDISVTTAPASEY